VPKSPGVMTHQGSPFPEREEMSISKSGNDTTNTATTTTDAQVTLDLGVDTTENADKCEMRLPTYEQSHDWAKKYVAEKPGYGGSIIEVSFTGHRPKDIAAPGVEGEVKSWMIDQLTRLLNQKGVGRVIVRSGFAAGVDLWAAGAALHLQGKGLDVRLHGYLPCQPERQVATWPKKSQAAYASLLEGADLYYVCTELEGEGRQNWSKVMNHRNRVMVEGSDVLMAVWNGRPGGTKNTVFIARDLEVPVVMYDPVTKETTTERFEGLVMKLRDLSGEEAPVSAGTPNSNTGVEAPDHDSREESHMRDNSNLEVEATAMLETMERIETATDLALAKEERSARIRETHAGAFDLAKKLKKGHDFTATDEEISPVEVEARPDLAELRYWEGVNMRHVAKHLGWGDAMTILPDMTRNGEADHGLAKDHPTELVVGPKLPSNLVERSRYTKAKAGDKTVTLMLVGDRDVDLHMEQTILGQDHAGHREQTRDEATRHRSLVRETMKLKGEVSNVPAPGNSLRERMVARDALAFDMKDFVESLGGSMDMRTGEASLDPRPGTHPGDYRMVGGIDVTPCEAAFGWLKDEDFIQKEGKATDKVLVLQRMEKRITEESSWFVASGDGAADLEDKINREEAYPGENLFENRISRSTADEYLQDDTVWKTLGMGSYSKRIDHVEVDGESSLPKHLRLAGIKAMFDITGEDAALVRQHLLRADMKEELHEAMKDDFRMERLTRDRQGNLIPQADLRKKWLPVYGTLDAREALPASGLKQLRILGERSFVETCRFIVEGWDAPTKNTGRLEGELSQPDWVLEDPSAFDMEDKVEVNDDDAWKEAMDEFGEAEVIESVETDDGEGWEFNPAFESDADLLQGYVSGHRKVDPNVDFKVDYREKKEVEISNPTFTYLGERHTVDSAITTARDLTNASERFSDLWAINKTKGLPWKVRKAVWNMASTRRPDLMGLEFDNSAQREVARTMADCADKFPSHIVQAGSWEKTPTGVAFQMTPGRSNPGLLIGQVAKVLPFVKDGASVSVSKVLAYDPDGHLITKKEGYYVENYLITLTNKKEDDVTESKGDTTPSLGIAVILTKEESAKYAAKLAKAMSEVMPGDSLEGNDRVRSFGNPHANNAGHPYAHLAPSHRMNGRMGADERLVCYLDK